MDKNAIRERGKALEDAFFGKENAKLLERMRRQATSGQLSEVSGITDEKTLDHLIENGFSASTMAALTLVPLISVAWADRVMNKTERKAILSAAHEVGIEKGSDSYRLVETMLDKRPPASLIDAWQTSIKATVAGLDDPTKLALREGTVDRAKRVAKVAGGLLGIATISAVEREQLAIIENAFT